MNSENPTFQTSVDSLFKEKTKKLKYNDPVRKKYKSGERHDPNEVNDLLLRAKEGGISTEFPWINSLTPKQAEEELIIRFRSLAASLVSVCKKGKYNPKSSSQKKILELFKTSNTSFSEMANLLRISLINYTEEDLMAIAVSSICEAIYKTQKNLAATITICFKENLKEIISGPSKLTSISDYNDSFNGFVSESFDNDSIFKIVIENLPDKYWAEVQDFLAADPKKATLSEELKAILKVELGLPE